MSVATREPQAPESYATFWEPVGTGTPAGPSPDGRAVAAPEEAKDAYLEFANVTEGPSVVARIKPA
jgi:hypothetical protein